MLTDPSVGYETVGKVTNVSNLEQIRDIDRGSHVGLYPTAGTRGATCGIQRYRLVLCVLQWRVKEKTKDSTTGIFMDMTKTSSIKRNLGSTEIFGKENKF